MRFRDRRTPHYERPSGEKLFLEALGESESFLEFQEHLSRVAVVDRPVLLLGERGTGKELAAHRIHSVSQRWSEPLITLNCASLAPTLIEAELFGHEEGAYTGAGKRRKGRFELAHEGTLFLDEVGNIPMQAQEKILRVVEYGTFERVGGNDSIEVDVRLIGATHSDLARMSREGKFKPDLLDRLSFDVLHLPPLRERKEDIPLLTNHFASRMGHELGRSEIPEFHEEALSLLESYPWPGNIRELKNVVERAVYRSDGPIVREIVFDPFVSPFSDSSSPSDESQSWEDRSSDPGPRQEFESKTIAPYAEAVRDLEVRLLLASLEEAKHNQKKAAQLLGMTYHQFRWLHQKYKDDLHL